MAHFYLSTVAFLPRLKPGGLLRHFLGVVDMSKISKTSSVNSTFDDMDCSTSKSCEEFKGLTLDDLVSRYIDKARDRMKKYLRY